MPGCIWEWLHLGIRNSEMVELNDSEFEQVYDAVWLLKKRTIASKIQDKLSETHDALRTIKHPDVLDPYFKNSGKISKGENYKGLPYYVLDYPRVFSKKELFAFRIIVWWGHYIIFTIISEGAINKRLDLGQLTYLKDWKLDTNKDPWTHELTRFDIDFSTKLIEDRLDNQIFIKFSKVLDLKKLNYLPEITPALFTTFLKLYT